MVSPLKFGNFIPHFIVDIITSPCIHLFHFILSDRDSVSLCVPPIRYICLACRMDSRWSDQQEVTLSHQCAQAVLCYRQVQYDRASYRYSIGWVLHTRILAFLVTNSPSHNSGFTPHLYCTSLRFPGVLSKTATPDWLPSCSNISNNDNDENSNVSLMKTMLMKILGWHCLEVGKVKMSHALI